MFILELDNKKYMIDNGYCELEPEEGDINDFLRLAKAGIRGNVNTDYFLYVKLEDMGFKVSNYVNNIESIDGTIY